jgi:dihydrofolate synthase/folylpolyglutamate synthase
VQEAVLRSASGEEPARVLICGSLYLAGHVLKLHAGR